MQWSSSARARLLTRNVSDRFSAARTIRGPSSGIAAATSEIEATASSNPTARPRAATCARPQWARRSRRRPRARPRAPRSGARTRSRRGGSPGRDGSGDEQPSGSARARQQGLHMADHVHVSCTSAPQIPLAATSISRSVSRSSHTGISIRLTSYGSLTGSSFISVEHPSRYRRRGSCGAGFSAGPRRDHIEGEFSNAFDRARDAVSFA